MQGSGEVTLRPATRADCWRVYRWRNLPEIVARGTSRRRVWPWEHWRWFGRQLADAAGMLRIVRADGEDCGLVGMHLYACQRADNVWCMRAALSIYLLPGWTGRGIGPAALRQAVAAADAKWGIVLDAVTAQIRADNQPSLRAFAKAGFTREWGHACERLEGHEEVIVRTDT